MGEEAHDSGSKIYTADHEHCELCFETISDKEGYQHEGYTDGKEWLCIDCYNKYIAPLRNKE